MLVRRYLGREILTKRRIPSLVPENHSSRCECHRLSGRFKFEELSILVEEFQDFVDPDELFSTFDWFFAGFLGICWIFNRFTATIWRIFKDFGRNFRILWILVDSFGYLIESNPGIWRILQDFWEFLGIYGTFNRFTAKFWRIFKDFGGNFRILWILVDYFGYLIEFTSRIWRIFENF